MLIGSMGSGKTHIGFAVLAEVKDILKTYYVTAAQLLKDSEDSL